MNNQNSDPTATGGNSQPLWLDVLCDRFKSAWGTSQQISIESILNAVAADKRELVLNSLLKLETDLRTKSGNPPTADELSRRFPDDSGIIATVLQNPQRGNSAADAKNGSNDETIPPKSPPHDDGDDDDGDDDGGDGVLGFGPMRIPRQLGRYRIIRKLGQGAMGSVFLAHDEQLNRQVALKIPRGDLQRNAELRTRFEREAQAAAALHHPGICPIFDVGQFEGIHYICMGYIDGFSLSRYAVAASGLSELDIAELAYKMARALAVAHEAGFIHRDLKPANVMVNQANDPVILDFGLARRIDRNEDLKVTQTGMAIGSPAYMSPEQVDGDQDKIGIPSDVYSLGVILYELLAGRVPFEGSMGSVLGQIMSKEPAKPSDFRKDLSVRLENICLKMMAKDPAKRHPSMHAVAADLKEYLEKYSALSSASVPPLEAQTAGKADQRKQQIEQLIKSGDYGQAEKLLVALARETDASLLEAATWAAAEIPKLRKTRDQVRAGRQEMYTTAVRLMKSHDYEQAARLLQEYPYDLRTPKMQQLLEQAETISDEVDQIRKEIQTARTRGDNEQLLVLLNALLELKPADRKAKELRELLTKRSVGPISNLLGKQQPSLIKEMGVGLQWLVLIACVVLVCGYPAWWWSHDFLTREPENSAFVDSPSDSQKSVDFDPASSVVRGFRFPDSGKFINSRPLTALNTHTPNQSPLNAYPWLSPDGLTIWWTREGNNFDQPGIYQATRNSTSGYFTGIHRVLANARLASLAPNGLEIVFLFDSNDDGKPQQLCSANRTSLRAEFMQAVPIKALQTIANPKGTAFSSDGLQLFIRGYRMDNKDGNQVLIATRSNLTTDWGAPTVLTVDSDARFQHLTWPSPASSNLLLFAGTTPSVAWEEKPFFASQDRADSMTFRDIRPILIDGQHINTRSVRYCTATGELFFTKPTGSPPTPYDQAELWVADSEESQSSPEANVGELTTWIDLFDGRTLKGWTVQGNDANWRVGNGIISGRSGKGWLVSDQEFGDFELSLEYELQYGTQSGVLLRAPIGQNLDGGSYLEIQLLHNQAPDYSSVAKDQKHGSLWSIVAANPVTNILANQWHSLTAKAVGNHITVSLDNSQVLNTDLAAIPGLQSKIPGAFRPSGAIALQLSDTPIEFRNVRIRNLNRQNEARGQSAVSNPAEISQSNWIQLFNGRDLTGWQRLGTSDWSVSAGAIRGITRVGQIRGWLMSDREYSDYELEIEYKLSESCNSGICPRARRDAEAKGSEFGEIQLLEAEAEKSTSYADNGRNGSLFGHVVRETSLQTAANQWHTLRYVVNGKHLLATINGTKMLDCDVPFLRPSGHIALQPNRNQVEFRSIRIREIGKKVVSQVSGQPMARPRL